MTLEIPTGGTEQSSGLQIYEQQQLRGCLPGKGETLMATRLDVKQCHESGQVSNKITALSQTRDVPMD